MSAPEPPFFSSSEAASGAGRALDTDGRDFDLARVPAAGVEGERGLASSAGGGEDGDADELGGLLPEPEVYGDFIITVSPDCGVVWCTASWRCEPAAKSGFWPISSIDPPASRSASSRSSAACFITVGSRTDSCSFVPSPFGNIGLGAGASGAGGGAESNDGK
jgi:hypothetical protein